VKLGELVNLIERTNHALSRAPQHPRRRRASLRGEWNAATAEVRATFAARSRHESATQALNDELHRLLGADRRETAVRGEVS